MTHELFGQVSNVKNFWGNGENLEKGQGSGVMLGLSKSELSKQEELSKGKEKVLAGYTFNKDDLFTPEAVELIDS